MSDVYAPYLMFPDGRIFPYSEHLASRKDATPCFLPARFFTLYARDDTESRMPYVVEVVGIGTQAGVDIELVPANEKLREEVLGYVRWFVATSDNIVKALGDVYEIRY